MRVLLDEQLPRQLGPYLIGYEVRTVQQESWAGLKNGELLDRAEAAGFAAVLTGDQSLSLQDAQAMSRNLDLTVNLLLAADAEVILRWRYPGRYALYDQSPGRESESAQYMLDPGNGVHAVRGVTGLVGYCSFGIDGRVPGGTYDDGALDVGAGMDPALVGRGHGRSFLDAVVE